MKEMIRDVYGEYTDEMISLFKEAYPGKNLTDLLLVDRAMRQPSKRLAKLHARGGKACAYLYDFICSITKLHGIALIFLSFSIIRSWWRCARFRM